MNYTHVIQELRWLFYYKRTVDSYKNSDRVANLHGLHKAQQCRKEDHFPLPFINQMLDRLAGQEYYYFLDGYNDYNQIAIVPQDQQKTTFKIFAFRECPSTSAMPQWAATFQRCMMAIFCDIVDLVVEVFVKPMTKSQNGVETEMG